MPKFRKRPVVIEAVQWSGENQGEIEAFCPKSAFYKLTNVILVDSIEGLVEAKLSDWIMRGVEGEYYVCNPAIFTKTYEAVDA